MSRSGYTDEFDDPWRGIMWRGRVASSIRGKRGQALLRDLLAALDAMPDKRLYPNSFATEAGEYCTLGVLGAARGIKMDDLGDADEGCDERLVADRFGVASPLVQEIMWMNDEYIDEFEWKTVELDGPQDPRRIGFGHPMTKIVRVPVPDAPHRRWQAMRNWVADQIKEKNT